ncbi:MAG: endonuclease/exonuclease/phosphatase family protein [Archangiaceae bacterium]|nr:endonuclease/exonuclease/phosphatase family protein [Archangiaceae bacterium]
MNADVLGLQEVGSREALDALAEAVDPVKFPPRERVFVDSGTPEGPQRRAADEVTGAKSGSAFGRDARVSRFCRAALGWKHHLLEVELDVAGNPMVVLVAHQATRADVEFAETTEAFRRAEAEYTRRVFDSLRAEDPTRAVVVCGDRNDEFANRSLQALRTGDGLVDALAAVSDAFRSTNTYRPQPGREVPHVFDHILVSDELGRSKSHAWVHASDEIEDASDHRPASVVLTY